MVHNNNKKDYNISLLFLKDHGTLKTTVMTAEFSNNFKIV